MTAAPKPRSEPEHCFDLIEHLNTSCAPIATGARAAASALDVATVVVHQCRHTSMSAPGQEDVTAEVKAYFRFKLREAQRQNRWFDSHDEFFSYLRSKGDLDDRCDEWLDNASPRQRREFFESHQNPRQHHASTVHAPSLDLGGPSVRHAMNAAASDSGIGSPPKDQPMESQAQDGSFDAHFFPIDGLDVEPRNLRARIDSTRTENMIDLEMGKEFWGDQIEVGVHVMVGYRFADDPDRTNTRQIKCVVGRIEENVIFAQEPPGFPHELRSGCPMGPAKFDEDNPEFKERADERLVQLLMKAAKNLTKEEDMQNRKRGPGDDSDRYHPARRVRTRQ